jgi:hypothetical protein
VDHPSRRPEEEITRTWGVIGRAPAELALFGREGLAFETGKGGPLRAAELFAAGRLKRAAPALASEPLAQIAQRLGDAPIRAFAPGPFEGEWKKGLGGVLGAATAAGLSVRVASIKGSGHARLDATLVLAGAWKGDAEAAATHLAAAFDLLEQTPFGKVTGLNHPVVDARAVGETDALVLTVSYDAAALAHGIHLAFQAGIGEVLREVDIRGKAREPPPAP